MPTELETSSNDDNKVTVDLLNQIAEKYKTAILNKTACWAKTASWAIWNDGQTNKEDWKTEIFDHAKEIVNSNNNYLKRNVLLLGLNQSGEDWIRGLLNLVEKAIRDPKKAQKQVILVENNPSSQDWKEKVRCFIESSLSKKHRKQVLLFRTKKPEKEETEKDWKTGIFNFAENTPLPPDETKRQILTIGFNPSVKDRIQKILERITEALQESDRDLERGLLVELIPFERVFGNFHSVSHRNHDDFLNETISGKKGTSELKLENIHGAYMTDLSDEIESNSADVEIETNNAKQRFEEQLEMLGAKEFHVVCFGDVCFAEVRKFIGHAKNELKDGKTEVSGELFGKKIKFYKIMHYSYPFKPCKAEERERRKREFKKRMKEIDDIIGLTTKP